MESIIGYVACIVIGIIVGGIFVYRTKKVAQEISAEASKIKEKFKGQ